MKYEHLVKKWFKINPFLMIFDDDFSKICDEEKPLPFNHVYVCLSGHILRFTSILKFFSLILILIEKIVYMYNNDTGQKR